MTTPVSFEIAKLLKEKGFANISEKSYILSQGARHGLLSNFTNRCNNAAEDDRIEAPTIAEVVMWLYEKHGVWICVDKAEDFDWWKFIIRKLQDTGYKNGGFGYDFNSPTEAYLGGIKYYFKKNDNE